MGFLKDLIVNPGRALLGSFSGNAVIEKCEENCCAEVSFKISDTLSWSSGTRYKPTSGGYKGGGISYIENRFWKKEVIDKISNPSVKSLLSSAVPDAQFVVPDNFFGRFGGNTKIELNWKKRFVPNKLYPCNTRQFTWREELR